jgi:hypothetical protein
MKQFTGGQPCASYGIPEDYCSLFSMQIRELDSNLSAILISYPAPGRLIEQKPGVPLLAPHFTAILFDPSSPAQFTCYVLGQSPTGGTTLRCVSGENSHGNCGEGCTPSVEAFVSLLKSVRKL